MINSSFENELNTNGMLIYKNKGVSMLPLIRQGKDVIVIEKKQNYQYKKLDAVLFKRKEPDGSTGYILHRILKVKDDGTFWIVGDNCLSGDVVKGEDILGLMTTVFRKKKKITLNSFSYKLYVNTYCRFYHLRFFYLKCLSLVKRLLYKIKCLFCKK